jgi:hypothetical protein
MAMSITTWAVILSLFASPLRFQITKNHQGGKKYAGAVILHILLIVKQIALAYKKGEGSTQAQGKIPSRAVPNYAWLDPSLRFVPFNIVRNA